MKPLTRKNAHHVGVSVKLVNNSRPTFHRGAIMQQQITRKNFRQEYNLLRLECEEVRQQNRRLKTEMIKLMEMMQNRKLNK